VAEFREYERASTTTIDAFVKPIVQSYVGRLERETAARGFGPVSLMQSNGGLLPVGFVLRRPVQMLFSGPAAGVTAAVRIAGALGIGDLVTLDMGGTSTDVCLVRGGRPSITTDAALDRIPVRVPMVDIVSVGAGGGSVVWVDSGGMLQVGPQSTGALPGPACYGRGGDLPTTTDANVVRGLLRPAHFLGGRFPLDPEAARRTLESVARGSGRSPFELAEDVFRIANATMAGATREVSVERGQDPRDLTLVAFGGAGPLHAASVAEDLSISRVLVPPHPGLVSAYGLLVADFQRDFSQTEVLDLRELSSEHVLDLLDRLEERARDELAGQGVDPETASRRFAVDMRYRGQGFELTVPITRPELLGGGVEELERRFHDAHLARYGNSRPGQRVQAVTYRLAVVLPAAGTGLLKAVAEPEREPEHLEILVGGQRTECTFSWRPSLRPGWQTDGPAVIEEDTSTTYVPPGWRAEVDGSTGILLECL
jgi:N-methylhydantoinase A